MVYITGDIHGDPRRFTMDIFPEQKEMNKDDYVIILGDFGLIWDWKGKSSTEKYWLDWLDNKSFTTLFIDGNHENHDRLDAFPIEEWNGGKIHRIRPSVLHLMRGQVYQFSGNKWFTFGGASSHDIKDGVLEPDDQRIKQWSHDRFKLFRVNKRSWWDRELPSQQEMEDGLNNLKNNGWKVDYILTHCASSSTEVLIGGGLYKHDYLTKYLQEVREKTDYRKWFFGHYHIDKQINTEEICLFENIIRVL